jgi:uncharacterized protein
MEIPTYQEIESLHKKYAPTEKLFASVWTHCRIVRDISEQLIDSSQLDIDKEVVGAGCLLHDIGVYMLFDEVGNKVDDYNYMNHGVRGEELLRKEGISRELWRIASHHLGVGFTQHDIEKQGLPFDQPYMPETIEERLITYADKFHSKTNPPRFNTYESFMATAKTYGDDIVTRFEKLKDEFGVPDLAPLVQKYGHEIK